MGFCDSSPGIPSGLPGLESINQSLVPVFLQECRDWAKYSANGARQIGRAHSSVGHSVALWNPAQFTTQSHSSVGQPSSSLNPAQLTIQSHSSMEQSASSLTSHGPGASSMYFQGSNNKDPQVYLVMRPSKIR